MTVIQAPTTGQSSDGNYYLNANGNWVYLAGSQGSVTTSFAIGQKLIFKTAAATDAYIVSQSDSKIVFYSTSSTGSARNVLSIQTDSNTSALTVNTPIQLTKTLLDKNGLTGLGGQVLTSTQDGVQWTDVVLPGFYVNSQTSAYELGVVDSQNLISITTGNVTVNGAVLFVGFKCNIFNNSSTSQEIIEGAGATLRLSGTTSTGNCTMAGYGYATIHCYASNSFVISGDVS